MIISTPLELYDLQILSQIQAKHPSVTNAKFLFAPPERETGWRMAEEKFGKQLFPIFFIFRNEPVIPSDTDTSAAKYLVNFNTSDTQSTGAINGWIKYQVDFYSNNMFDMNKVNVEYFKFLRTRSVDFDFTDYGVPWSDNFEVLFDGIDGMNSIEEMFSIGRYYRYTYKIRVLVPIFDVNTEVSADQLVFSLYGNNQLLETITKDL